MTDRHIGLWGATGVGVGAIVGGGVLALAGAAFAATGPSAIVAFGLNGLIALLTALSFAEVSSKFPQSGGTYTFAKKVLSVEAAFTVGWVVWFASIVAATLYAVGFGWFGSVVIADLIRIAGGQDPAPILQSFLVRGLAVAATAFYSLSLLRRSTGGDPLTNIGKVIVFAILILGGIWFLARRSEPTIAENMIPFFAGGAAGLFQAMGFSFIALQGFDLIAAVAGEIRDPERNLPRAMLGSLGIALVIYLPFLFIVATAGMAPGQSITVSSQEHPENIVAIAAQNYLGPFGYWLVLVAALLSMLSALQANLFAASRVAMAMGRDRNLPQTLGVTQGARQTPRSAILVTAAIIVAIVLVVPDTAAAGAAASLIFLITFALAHAIALLVRRRSVHRPPPFKVPLFPAVPIVGGLACMALAIYQGFAVPSAGLIATTWLSIGGLLFLGIFARRARITDESVAALDPEVVQLRGRSPLVLVPIAHPDHARGLVDVASALAPPDVGRALLLSVVVAPRDWQPSTDPQPLERAQHVLSQAITASVHAKIFPEALATVAAQPFDEIGRVAKSHRCESLLMGLGELKDDAPGTALDRLINSIDCDLVVLRAQPGFRLSDVHRILVPTGGRGGHDRLLARLIGSLSRHERREVEFIQVQSLLATDSEHRSAQRELERLANDLCAGASSAVVVRNDSPIDAIVDRAKNCDLVILGVQRLGRRQKLFGDFVREIARRTTLPLIVVSWRH